MLMKIEQAIQKLIARNKNFVAKNGISDYSRETDEIINAILKLYHKHKALQDRVKHMEHIFHLYEIDENDYQIPDVYLEFLNEQKYKLISPLMMEHLIIRFKSIDNAIKSYYKEILFLRELINNNKNPEVVDYAKKQIVKNELYQYQNNDLDTILKIFRPKYLRNIEKELQDEQYTYSR